MFTEATVGNMLAAKDAGKHCYAISTDPRETDQVRANPDDYMYTEPGWRLRDSAGVPMILVTAGLTYRDALTGEEVFPPRP